MLVDLVEQCVFLEFNFNEIPSGYSRPEPLRVPVGRNAEGNSKSRGSLKEPIRPEATCFSFSIFDELFVYFSPKEGKSNALLYMINCPYAHVLTSDFSERRGGGGEQ